MCTDVFSIRAVANLTTLATSNRTVLQPQLKWSAFDQVMSVIAGYAFFTIAGAIYLQRKRAMAQDGQPSRGVERRIIEGLAQAGSVMKVVLIIGIEMFVFPLYCGILLGGQKLPSSITSFLFFVLFFNPLS